MRLVFLISVFLSLPALASPSAYVRRLARAKSAIEISEVRSQFERLQVANRACRLQMSAKAAPLACYESLKLEDAWGMHSLSSRNRLLQKLDWLCAEAAQKFLVPLRTPIGVSAKCRAEVDQAIRIISYRENAPTWSEN